MGKRNDRTPFLCPKHAFSVSCPRPSALQYLYWASQDSGSKDKKPVEPWDHLMPLGVYEKVLTLHTTTTMNSFFSLISDGKSSPQ